MHVGIDLFLPAGEVVRAPLDGVVEASAELRRGLRLRRPMAILRHETDGGVPFWTLYGHLEPRLARPTCSPAGPSPAARSSPASAPYPENGSWPPHLHLQLLTDLLDLGRACTAWPRRPRLDVWERSAPIPTWCSACRAAVRADAAAQPGLDRARAGAPASAAR